LSFPEGRRQPAAVRPSRRGRQTGGRGRGRSQRPPEGDQQSIVVRRTIALLAAVLVVVLLVVGINSCLDSRKDSAFRDYGADVRALVNAEQDLSGRLFETLSKPGRGDALDVQTQVNAMRVDAEQLVDRAKGTDHPDDLNTAQGWLVTAFEFRADAIGKIATLLPTALGDKGKQAAIDSIAGQMQALLASDVIYSQRAIPALTSAFDKRGIEERFPNERFLPDLGWLDPDTVQSRLEQLGGTQQAATPGLHGTSLEGVTVQPAGTVLTDSGINRIPLTDQLAFDVKVQNGGDSEETDVGVSITIGDGQQIKVDQTIPRIAAGQSETVSIPITEKPTTSGVSTVTIAIAAVPGEENTDNNKATYQVAFTGG
jgi:CARDB protein